MLGGKLIVERTVHCSLWQHNSSLTQRCIRRVMVVVTAVTLYRHSSSLSGLLFFQPERREKEIEDSCGITLDSDCLRPPRYHTHRKPSARSRKVLAQNTKEKETLIKFVLQNEDSTCHRTSSLSRRSNHSINTHSRLVLTHGGLACIKDLSSRLGCPFPCPFVSKG